MMQNARMPCYMFTYHGHGTWMPDNPRGYVHRQYGLQPPDPHMAEHYRHNQRQEAVHFTHEMQSILIDTACNAGAFIDALIHGCATEPTHIHVVASWKHAREWKSMRASIRSALSRALNDKYGKRDWFSDSPSRKRVRDHEHFDYLLLEYFPDHHQSWVREVAHLAAEARAALRDNPVRGRNTRRRKRIK